MRKYYLLALLCWLVPVSVMACNSEQLKSDRKLAEVIKVDYQYNTSNDNFKVALRNVHRDFYVVITGQEKAYEPVASSEFVTIELGTYPAGTNLDVRVYPYVQTFCQDELLTRKYIRLPYYNPYSTNSECSKLGECAYCNKFTYMKLTEKTWGSGVNQCINEKKNANTADLPDIEVKTSLLDNVWEALKDFKIFQIIGIISIVAIIIGLRIYKKEKESEL